LWHYIRWRIFSGAGGSSLDGVVLCGASGALSDGAPSFLVVETLDQMAHLSVVLVVFHLMAQSLVWFWCRFIRWRTVSSGAGRTFRRRKVLSGAGGALSYGTPSLLMLVVLQQMAHLFLCWWLFIGWRSLVWC
jgi:hypothetical protein